MNERSVGLAVTLAAVLGAPAANAQEQPLSIPAPDAVPIESAPDLATPSQTVALQTPTVESGATIEFTAQAVKPLTSGPLNVTPAQRSPQTTSPQQKLVQPIPAIAPIQPTSNTTAIDRAVVQTAAPIQQAPTVETNSAVEFSVPANRTTTSPGSQPSNAVIVQQTPPIDLQTSPTIVDPGANETNSNQPNSNEPLQDKLMRLQQQQQQMQQEIDSLKKNLANSNEPATVAEEQQLRFSVEGLFLKPRTSSLIDYAITDPGVALAVSGELNTVKYEDVAALRLSLGYQFPRSGWDVAISHTFFNTKGDGSTIAPPNGFVFSTLSHPFQNESANTASATAKLDYSATDAEAGYRFQIGKRLGVRLFGGLRFANVNQGLTVNYDGIDYTNGEIKIGNDFSGFGPRLGVEARVQLGSGFSLFGRGAGSLLIGDLTSTYRETDRGGADLIADLRRNQNQHTVPVVEAALGVDWQTKLGKRSKLNLSAGYEYQYFFNVSDDARFVDSSSPGVFARSPGDLSLQGFFIKGGLSFEF